MKKNIKHTRFQQTGKWNGSATSRFFSHRNTSHVTGGRNQSASELILLLSGVAGNSFFLFFLVRAAAATVSHCGSVSGNERTLSRSAHARFFSLVSLVHAHLVDYSYGHRHWSESPVLLILFFLSVVVHLHIFLRFPANWKKCEYFFLIENVFKFWYVRWELLNWWI